MYKVRKLNFALNVRKGKQTGKYFLKLLHVYIFIRKSKSEIMKRKTKQQKLRAVRHIEKIKPHNNNELFCCAPSRSDKPSAGHAERRYLY